MKSWRKRWTCAHISSVHSEARQTNSPTATPRVHMAGWPFCACSAAHARLECALLSPLVRMGAPKCPPCTCVCVSECNRGAGLLFSIPFPENKTTTCPDEQARPRLARSPRKQIEGEKEWECRPKKISVSQCCAEQTCLGMSYGAMGTVKSSLSSCRFSKKREKE